MAHPALERANALLEKAMPILTPAGVVAGFLLGDRIAGLAPLATLFFACITFSGALGMSARDFIRVLKHPLALVVFFIACHVVIPGAVKLAASVAFPAEPLFITGFVLLFSIPTAVSGFIWTSIHRGSGPLSLSLILLDTLLAPIVVPATVAILAHANVRIDSAGMCMSLVWMVVLPSILGIFLNQASEGHIAKIIVPVSKPLSKLLLLAVIAINVARVSHSVTKFEPVFAALALACLAFSFSGFCVGKLAAKIAGAGDAESVTLMYAVGLRNISAALVLVLDFFPSRAALPVITGIVFQQTLASVAGLVLAKKKRPAKTD